MPLFESEKSLNDEVDAALMAEQFDQQMDDEIRQKLGMPPREPEDFLVQTFRRIGQGISTVKTSISNVIWPKEGKK